MIPAHYTYLAVDICCILFPLVFSFFPQFRFVSEWRFFVVPCIATAAFFILWDILFTAIGVWSFSAEYTVGLRVLGLPLEEYLFFICIPYACTFTYYCLTSYFRFTIARRAIVSRWLMIIILVAFALLYPGRLYTSVTFSLLAALLIFLTVKRVDYLPAFFFSFCVILIPFFISNGILTGSFAGRTVVIYNNSYNLGARLLTIPVEDVFYGMLLMLINIAGFEYLRGKVKAMEDHEVKIAK